MNKTKAMVLGIIGSVLLFFSTTLGYNLIFKILNFSLNSKDSLFIFLLFIFSLIAFIGSLLIRKKQRLGGVIILFGGILTIVAVILGYLTNYYEAMIAIPSVFLFPLALIFVFIAAFMAIFSKTEESQVKVQPAQEQILKQDIKQVRDIGVAGGVIALLLSILLSFFAFMAYAMSPPGHYGQFGLIKLIIGIVVPIISSIIIIFLSDRIVNNTKTKSIILIILSGISLCINHYNIAFIATLIAGIKGLRIKNNF